MMGRISLPKLLTPAVIKAVSDNLSRCFDEWLTAEQRRAPPALQEQLQIAYERANAVYHEALARAEREGVPFDG
ncbi:MAG: hypothetical protein H0X24_19335 [Ktedonobacterales bacterium]|nr:hypothetical protein [Ktedonobacterales bacterium]